MSNSTIRLIIKIESPCLSPRPIPEFHPPEPTAFNTFGCISWYYLTFTEDGTESGTRWALCKRGSFLLSLCSTSLGVWSVGA